VSSPCFPPCEVAQFFEIEPCAPKLGGNDADSTLDHRDVLEGRWTFEIVERFDDDYYSTARSDVTRLVDRLVGGRRHAHEAVMRSQRRVVHPPFLADDLSA
jgi:hypothetical protein